MSEPVKDPIRETDAEAIRLGRTLVRGARHGALAVLDPETGAPLASRVGLATDVDGSPLLLVSGLAAHTGAMRADPRCSLLVGEPGKGDPLAHPRMTLICRAVPLEAGTPDHGRARWRYLSRNPKAKLYADLPDFRMFRLDVEKASLNGGFGKAYALTAADLVLEGPAVAEIGDFEQQAVDHMNDDHLDAIAGYARHYAKADGDGWTMTGLDPDGFDIARGDDTRRIFFEAPLVSARSLRDALVEMAKTAREAERQQA